MNHIPKVVAPSQHTGQPVLLKKALLNQSQWFLKQKHRNQPVLSPIQTVSVDVDKSTTSK